VTLKSITLINPRLRRRDTGDHTTVGLVRSIRSSVTQEFHVVTACA
jgi:hypothetical protein